jgi:hypothetical protein
MSPLKKAAPPAPKPSTGFDVVIGPRSAIHRYEDRPWAEVLAAARAGQDGLRADTFGSPTASAADQEFVLREMEVGPTSAFHGYCSLWQQRW